jgi:hypothetical protein
MDTQYKTQERFQVCLCIMCSWRARKTAPTHKTHHADFELLDRVRLVCLLGYIHLVVRAVGICPDYLLPLRGKYRRPLLERRGQCLFVGSIQLL